MPLAFAGIFSNDLAYSGIFCISQKYFLTYINLVKLSRIDRTRLRNITSIMFDVPLAIQHTYVQLGTVLTIKDIYIVTLFPFTDFN